TFTPPFSGTVRKYLNLPSTIHSFQYPADTATGVEGTDLALTEMLVSLEGSVSDAFAVLPRGGLAVRSCMPGKESASESFPGIQLCADCPTFGKQQK
ncbi:MAG: hypothetical protein ACI4HI_15110, partial [Lachnospiraceae bacterium]